MLYKAVKEWELRPLAVYFDDWFDNPVAVENMNKACRKLNVELRVITSGWEESRDLKISLLKASVPELSLSTDLGIAAALYGAIYQKGIKFILIA